MVPAPQGLKDCKTNLMATHLGADQAQSLLDLDGDLLESAERERPVLRSRLHPGDDLRSVEGLPLSRPLHHNKGHFLEPLVRREAPATSEALPPASDGSAVFGRARIDNPVFGC